MRIHDGFGTANVSDQFCRLLGSDTLLEQTRRRAALLLSPERVLTVVVRQHERFYTPAPVDRPSQRLVVQPDAVFLLH